MIDIGKKKVTRRKAIAEGKIYLDAFIIEEIKRNKVPKGNVLETAKTAALFAIKNTPFIIPYCHPVKITKAEINFKVEKDGIKVECAVYGLDRTGFEMEALTGVSVFLLTVYDMCKLYKKEMKISEIKLLEKQK